MRRLNRVLEAVSTALLTSAAIFPGLALAIPPINIVTFSTDTTVIVPTPNITLTAQAGSVANTFTVNSSTIDMVIDAGDSVTLIDPTKGQLNNNGGVNNCYLVSNQNVVTFTGPLTITVTPSTTACVSDNGEGTVPLGSSGSYYNPSITTTTTSIMTTSTVVTPIVATPTEFSAEATVIHDVQSANTASHGLESAYVAGSVAHFAYAYTNTTAKTQHLTIIREFLTPQGKLIKRYQTAVAVKPKKIFKANIREPLKKTLPPGTYTMRIRILSGKTTLDSLVIPVVVETPEIFPADVSSTLLSTKGVKSLYTLGSTISFTYTYTNTTGKRQTIIVSREFINPNGRRLNKSTAILTLKSGAIFKKSVRETLKTTYASGAYTMRINVTSGKNILDFLEIPLAVR